MRDAYDKQKYEIYGSISRVGRRPFSSKLLTASLQLIGEKIKFINSWFQTPEANYIWNYNLYEGSIKKLPKKISTTKPETSPNGLDKNTNYLLRNWRQLVCQPLL